MPKSGTAIVFQQFSLQTSLISIQKEFLQNQLANLKSEEQNIMHLYKQANIDYEKIKYIDDLEKKDKIIKIKKDEEKDLDEIAIMLFNGE
jgi:predicted transcriptional regulator